MKEACNIDRRKGKRSRVIQPVLVSYHGFPRIALFNTEQTEEEKLGPPPMEEKITVSKRCVECSP